MRGNATSDREFFDAMRRERDRLIQQIRASQETIERSLQLVEQMDEFLGQSKRNE